MLSVATSRRIAASWPAHVLLLGRIFAVERGGADREASGASLLHHGDLLGRIDGAGDVDGLGHRGADRLDKRWNVFPGPVGQQVKAMHALARRERPGTLDDLLDAPFQHAGVARDTAREGAIFDTRCRR